MNNYPFMIPNNSEQNLLCELRKMNETLLEIARILNTNTNQKENNYLKKDTTYHIL